MKEVAMTAPVRRREIRALTGLRGIAALWVMVGHSHAKQVPTPGIIQHALDHKGLAVDLFLILSGFVLAMAYGQTEGMGRPWVGMRTFLQNRLARIYPLYLITTIACYVVISKGWLHFGQPSLSRGAVLANALMVQSWWGTYGSINGPGWSVSTEWAANLLFPVLATLVLAGSRLRALTLAAGCLVVLAVIACAIGGSYEGHTVTGALQVLPEVPGLAPFAIARNLAEFTIGMVCWRLSLNPVIMSVFARTSVTILVFAALLVLLVIPSLDVVSILLFVPLLLGLSSEHNLVARAFGSPIPRWFGMISFSIYLVHIPLKPLCDAIQHWILQNNIPSGALLASVIRAMLPIGVAYATYALIERPGQKWFGTRGNATLGTLDMNGRQNPDAYLGIATDRI